MSLHSASRPKDSGFTIIELMVAIALLAVLAGLAAPAFNSMLDRHRASGLAAALAADMQLLRSHALKSNGETAFTLDASGYSIVAGTTQIKTVSFADTHTNTEVAFIDPDAELPLELTFNPILARLNEGATALLVSSGDQELTLTVNPLGRVSICGGFGGHPSC